MSPLLRPWRIRLGERLRGLGLPAVSPSYEALAREASDEVLVTAPDGSISFCSPSFSRRWNLDRWALVGRDAFDWVHPEDRAAARERLAAACAGSRPVDSEHRYLVLATGEVRWVRVRFSDARHQRGVGGIIWNCRDVTDERRSVEALRYAATHDALTGLANRRKLFEAFRQALTDGERTGLLLLNLDGLKAVNDRFGHGAGDDVVRAVADRLGGLVRDLVGDRGWLARFDGDEFAVLVSAGDPAGDGRGPGDVAAALAALADRAVRLVRLPVAVEGRAVVVTASAGSAVRCAGSADDDPEEAGRDLFRCADVALAAAKAWGRDRWVPFDQDLLDAAHERAELAADLRQAVAERALHVVYQPLVDLTGAGTVGFEALVRWRHPRRGDVPPAVFVELAEESETILHLGAFVLDTALAALVDLHRAAGRDDLEMSVNVSGHQLLQPDLVAAVAQAVARHGLAPRLLCLEVTESAAVADLGAARNTLAQLRSLGVRIALDDFGTGYSSLSYLRRLPVDVLKIDKSFVDDCAEGAGAAVLSGIAALSSALGLVTVAEGIETPHSHDVVRGAGCTWGQGYLFARPLALPAAVAHLLAETGHRGEPQNVRDRSTTA